MTAARFVVSAVVMGLPFCALAQSSIPIPRVDQFPKLDERWTLIDWKARTNSFLDFVLNPIAKGDYEPLFWWDDTRIWEQKTTFGLPSYIGMKGQWGVFKNAHESIVTISVLLTGSMVGRDMSSVRLPGNTTDVDLVDMQTNYFSPAEGIFLDGIGSHSGQSFWYDIYPNILVGALVAKNPKNTALANKWKTASLKWAAAVDVLDQQKAFDKLAINVETMTPTVGSHTEPDAAAGLAYLTYLAYKRFGNPELLKASQTCLNWLDQRSELLNPNFEMLTAYGALAAARSNAESGTKHNVGKLVNWCFDDSTVRGRSPQMPLSDHGDRYGVIYGYYGDQSVAGLVGAMHYTISEKTGPTGYGFGFDTLAYAWPLVAAVRYEPRLAHGIGKWMLYASDAVRLTYPDQVVPSRQTCYTWASANGFSIPYEGLMQKNYLTGASGPLAAGDPLRLGWGPLDLSIYSGAMVGVFGAIVRPSPVPRILRLNLDATDFHAGPSYPTELLYNPGPNAESFDLDPGKGYYDSVQRRWLKGSRVTLGPDQAAVIAQVPSDVKLSKDHRKLLANGIVLDFWAYPAD